MDGWEQIPRLFLTGPCFCLCQYGVLLYLWYWNGYQAKRPLFLRQIIYLIPRYLLQPGLLKLWFIFKGWRIWALQICLTFWMWQVGCYIIIVVPELTILVSGGGMGQMIPPPMCGKSNRGHQFFYLVFLLHIRVRHKNDFFLFFDM